MKHGGLACKLAIAESGSIAAGATGSIKYSLPSNARICAVRQKAIGTSVDQDDLGVKKMEFGGDTYMDNTDLASVPWSVIANDDSRGVNWDLTRDFGEWQDVMASLPVASGEAGIVMELENLHGANAINVKGVVAYL